MEGLIAIQLDIHNKIVNGFANYKKTPKARLTVSYTETRLGILDEQWSKFEENHHSILSQSIKVDTKENPYFVKAIYDSVEELYVEYKSILKESLCNFASNTTQHTNATLDINKQSDIHRSSAVKLPKIELPFFSGKYMEWPTFHDLFDTLIHQNPSLAGVQKLHYLKTHITGEAEQILRHITISERNYELCWQQLKRRYGNKRYVSANILSRLIGQKSLAAESATGIKQLLDTTNECMNALSNIGINTYSWDTIIIYITSTKLDNDTRKQWEHKLGDHVDELPSLWNFYAFLESRFRALEFLEPSKDKKPKERIEKSTVFSITTTVTCPFCSEHHFLYRCKAFAEKDCTDRREFVQRSNICFNCFGFHRVTKCKSRTSCRLCRRRHHTLLHSDENSGSSTMATNSKESNQSRNTSACISTNFSYGSIRAPRYVLLATALVKLENKGTTNTFRALLDQGSQASFVSERVVQTLGLKRSFVEGAVSGLGGDQLNVRVKHVVKFKLQSTCTSFNCDMTGYVLKNLTSTLPGKRVHIDNWSELSGLCLADPTYDIPNRVDILLGADVYGQILLDGLIRDPPGTLTAQNTQLGWIISGHVPIHNEHSNNSIVNMHIQEDSANELLRKFWEVETEQPPDFLSREDKACEDHFTGNTTRDSEGRYVVRLPFRDSDPLCKYGDTKSVALNRFKSLERRFIRDPDLKKKYAMVLNEYILLNHMEAVRDQDELCRSDCVYLPHHAVVREDKITTKVRVVFDASCKGLNGRSLNDDLLVGPRLQPELRHILMQWRKHPFCFVADIIKMYRQVKVNLEDTNYQRLFWRNNPNEDLTEYRMLRVTFGVATAPYLAVKSLQQVAKDEGRDFPMAVDRVLQDFYVDDLISGSETEQEAIEVYHQITTLLSRAGFTLQKWASNSTRLMKTIRETSSDHKELETKQNDVIKTLGLSWDLATDSFKYSVNLPSQSQSVTKRIILSEISRLFDPLGWIAPVIVKAKIFLQKLWLCGVTWDEAVPSGIFDEWNIFRSELLHLNNLKLPRWIRTTKGCLNTEVHGFCDASNNAFAAAVYLRVVDKSGTHISLIAARTKVAPIKQISIPRLELCGAELLANLLMEVSSILGIHKSNIRGWTDSTIVLAWLKGQPNRWKTFVANRVSKIVTILDNDQWSHVESSQNPADCASRGLSPSELLKHKNWFNGPDWLQNEVIRIPCNPTSVTTLEEKSIKSHLSTSDANQRIPEDLTLWTRYSSLKKLVRVVACCQRFIQKCRDKTSIFTIFLSAKEYNNALYTCIKYNQNLSFFGELKCLKKSDPISRSSRLRSLCPFLDSDGILRVRGRISLSDVSYDIKHPIILCSKHYLSKLIIKDAHEQTLHGGPQLMLTYIRNKYWIINVKNSIKAYIRQCMRCIRYKSTTQNPLMGELPKARVTISRPFSRCGVDFAGPINIRISKGRGCKSYKGYISLFICMATRAIHLEAVSDLTTQGFLAAFKRFVARRGQVTEIWSDNGTNFIGASKELRKLFEAERLSIMQEVADCLTGAGTEWHFIPPHAPNFGGLWEAGVRSTKYHLKRILDGATLTYEELSTVLAQVEACLNSRPMYSLPSSHDEPGPLTPSHFLIGEQLVSAPDNNYHSSNVGVLSRWQLTQKMMQEFWRRWSHDYLTTLYQRYKWTKVTSEPDIGTLVLIKENDLPPSKWLLGIIEEKHPGPDKVTRVVTLRCKNSKFKRPVSKLIILPFAS